MDINLLLAFAATFFVFAASPGPDNMTIVARTVTHGPASGLAYALGTVCGILIYLALAAFGLSLLASEMGGILVFIRYAGALYLVWMAWKLWSAPAELPQMHGAARREDMLRLFLTGIALNLGNPKMPLFYVALLPNFVGPGMSLATVFELAVTIVLVEIAVVGAHIALANKARSLLRRPPILRCVNRGLAAFFLGAGALVLASHRNPS